MIFCESFNIEDGRKYATFWHIMLHYFKKGKNVTETQKMTCAGYGEGAVTDGTYQKCFCEVSWPNNVLLWDCLMYWKTFSSTPGSTL